MLCPLATKFARLCQLAISCRLDNFSGQLAICSDEYLNACIKYKRENIKYCMGGMAY